MPDMSAETTEKNAQEQAVEKAERLHSAVVRLSDILERVNFSAYMELLQKPGKVFILNFLFGAARGFGMALGMTLLFAIFIYSLSYLVDLPLVGKYIAVIVKVVHEELKK